MPIRKKPKFDITVKNCRQYWHEKRIDVALGQPRLTRPLLPMECIGNMQTASKQHERQFTEIQRQFTEIQRQLTELQRQFKTIHGTTTGEQTSVENDAGKPPHRFCKENLQKISNSFFTCAKFVGTRFCNWCSVNWSKKAREGRSWSEICWCSKKFHLGILNHKSLR